MQYYYLVTDYVWFIVLYGVVTIGSYRNVNKMVILCSFVRNFGLLVLIVLVCNCVRLSNILSCHKH